MRRSLQCARAEQRGAANAPDLGIAGMVNHWIKQPVGAILSRVCRRRSRTPRQTETQT